MDHSAAMDSSATEFVSSVEQNPLRVASPPALQTNPAKEARDISANIRSPGATLAPDKFENLIGFGVELRTVLSWSRVAEPALGSHAEPS